MVFIGLISTSLQPLSPTSRLPSTPQPFPCRVRAKRVVVAVPKKSLVTIILVRSPSNFIFTQFGCWLTAPKRKKLKFPNFISLTKWGGCPSWFWFDFYWACRKAGALYKRERERDFERDRDFDGERERERERGGREREKEREREREREREKKKRERETCSYAMGRCCWVVWRRLILVVRKQC